MKNIRVSIPELLNKIKQMSDDEMVEVDLTLIDKSIDQNTIWPPFIHFEAISQDGRIFDYESIDAVLVSTVQDRQDT